MADIVQWYEILAEIRAATDTVGSQNPPDQTSTDPGLNSLANRCFKRLYDKIAEANPQDWLLAQTTITTVGGQQDYDLTTLIPTIYRARYLDYVVNPTNQAKINLLPYTVDHRNDWLFGQPNLIPPNMQLLVSYVPKAPWLQEYASLTLNSQDGVDGLVFTAVAPGNVGLNVSVQITVSGAAAPTWTVNNIRQIVINVKTGGDTLQNIINALGTSANQAAVNAVVGVASLTGLNSDTIIAASGPTNLCGNVAFDFISGWGDYVISAAAAKVMGRLDLDPTFQVAESQESMANVSAMSAVRDSGHSDSLRDEEADSFGGSYGYAAPTNRTVLYRFAGTNLSLRAIWPGGVYI